MTYLYYLLIAISSYKETKKLAKRTLDKDNSEDNKAAYKTAKKEATGTYIAIAKARAYDNLYADMDNTVPKDRRMY